MDRTLRVGRIRKKLNHLALGILAVMVGSFSFAQTQPVRTVHVFVALADNQHQGIVPVPTRIGNGFDAERNLYWGSAAGVKTFFKRSPEWQFLNCSPKPKWIVLERCVFKYKNAEVYLIADAYRGDEIRQAILDFLVAAAGDGEESLEVSTASGSRSIPIRGGSDLMAYVGHDGLMDFQLPLIPRQKNKSHRDAIILACASRQYFSSPLRATGAYPLLWTTGLMAPEAYTLKSALDAWIANEDDEKVHQNAARAYDRYQKCGMRAALRLFATGW